MQPPLRKLHKSPTIVSVTLDPLADGGAVAGDGGRGVAQGSTQICVAQAARVLFAGRYDAGKGVDTAPHQHTSWELVYYLSGTAISFWPGEERLSTPGRAWLTPPRTVHGERASSPFTCYYVGLEMPDDTDWPRWVEDDRHGSLAQVCRSIIQEHARAQHMQRHATKPVPAPYATPMLSLLLQQLELLLRRAEQERDISPRERLVTRAEQWLSEKCAEPLRLADVARALGACPASLRNAFAEERGTSARAYLQRVRVQKALSLLRSSSIKLETVAEMTGYDSASHLTRAVKQATGQTPGALRRADPT